MTKFVTYNYRISYNELDLTASVDLTMKVRNEQGLAIKAIKQTTKDGEFSYEWNEKDDRGCKVPSVI